MNLREWRRSHPDPVFPDRVMMRLHAAMVVGLSEFSYADQVNGRRQLTRQTQLLMLAWDLMNKRQRTEFMEEARALYERRRRKGTGHERPDDGLG